jgi:hypothetical protein
LYTGLISLPMIHPTNWMRNFARRMGLFGPPRTALQMCLLLCLIVLKMLGVYMLTKTHIFVFMNESKLYVFMYVCVYLSITMSHCAQDVRCVYIRIHYLKHINIEPNICMNMFTEYKRLRRYLYMYLLLCLIVLYHFT